MDALAGQGVLGREVDPLATAQQLEHRNRVERLEAAVVEALLLLGEALQVALVDQPAAAPG